MQDPHNNDHYEKALHSMYHGRGDARKIRAYRAEREAEDNILPFGDRREEAREDERSS